MGYENRCQHCGEHDAEQVDGLWLCSICAPFTHGVRNTIARRTSFAAAAGPTGTTTGQAANPEVSALPPTAAAQPSPARLGSSSHGRRQPEAEGAEGAEQPHPRIRAQERAARAQLYPSSGRVHTSPIDRPRAA